jgi:hypothetical protein
VEEGVILRRGSLVLGRFGGEEFVSTTPSVSIYTNKSLALPLLWLPRGEARPRPKLTMVHYSRNLHNFARLYGNFEHN